MLSASTMRLAAEALRAIAHDLDQATGNASTTVPADFGQPPPGSSGDGAAKPLSADELVTLREQILEIIRHHVTNNAGASALTVKQIFARFSANTVRDLTTHNLAAALAALREAFPPQ
jgi:hypothetical protein